MGKLLTTCLEKRRDWHWTWNWITDITGRQSDAASKTMWLLHNSNFAVCTTYIRLDIGFYTKVVCVCTTYIRVDIGFYTKVVCMHYIWQNQHFLPHSLCIACIICMRVPIGFYTVVYVCTTKIRVYNFFHTMVISYVLFLSDS